MKIVYTDGSCLRNPDGPGGWAFVLLNEKNDIEMVGYGSDPCTTNNRMELSAIIEFLVEAPPGDYKIYTDSQLTMNCASGKWKRKANTDLWSVFDNVSRDKNLLWHWVKAHNGDKYNEMVDELARNSAKSVKK